MTNNTCGACRRYEECRQRTPAPKAETPACRRYEDQWPMASKYCGYPVVKSIRALAAGTIASLTNFRQYDEIDKVRESVARFAERKVTDGLLWSDATWQDAWNLYKVSHDTYLLANSVTP